ncbi:MAG TPA: hypothetical protein VM345_01775 [Acidimicrobiales bacterium]|nr:hypothetical protein [Acidimicrobiales bacterium]
MAELAHPDVLKQAKAERQERIKKMRACECGWPITRYRNGDGHHPECPAHQPDFGERSEP